MDKLYLFQSGKSINLSARGLLPYFGEDRPRGLGGEARGERPYLHTNKLKSMHDEPVQNDTNRGGLNGAVAFGTLENSTLILPRP